MGVVIILIVFPFNLEISPERKLQIFDSYGKPISNALIRQTWYQYSLGERGVIKIKTNSNGQALILKKEIRTRIISLFGGAVKEFMSTGIHASYGSHESITIFVNGHPNKTFYDGKGLESGKVNIDFEETVTSNNM
jgi:hypothetical protein